MRAACTLVQDELLGHMLIWNLQGPVYVLSLGHTRGGTLLVVLLLTIVINLPLHEVLLVCQASQKQSVQGLVGILCSSEKTRHHVKKVQVPSMQTVFSTGQSGSIMAVQQP